VRSLPSWGRRRGAPIPLCLVPVSLVTSFGPLVLFCLSLIYLFLALFIKRGESLSRGGSLTFIGDSHYPFALLKLVLLDLYDNLLFCFVWYFLNQVHQYTYYGIEGVLVKVCSDITD
jgi:hypothetical protein